MLPDFQKVAPVYRAFGTTKSRSNELKYGAIFLPSAIERIGLKAVTYAFVRPAIKQQQIKKSGTILLPGASERIGLKDVTYAYVWTTHHTND